MRSKGDNGSMRAGFLEGYEEGSGSGGEIHEASNNQREESQRAHIEDASSTFPSEPYQSAGFAAASLAEPPPDETTWRDEQPASRYSWFVLKLTVTSALGGFLFGYDTGVVSGAMLLIVDDFSLTDVQQEIIVSITIAAAVTAALVGGPGMERCGRRPVILLAAIIFTVGAIMLAASRTYETLVFGRLIVGLGIGLASLATPVYIAEAAPSHVRGTLVTLNTLFITMGQVVAGVVDGLFSGTSSGWRYMLGLSGVPSFFMTLGFLFLPESPRWLVSAGRSRDALEVLQRIRGTSDVHAEMDEMIESATDHAGGLKESLTLRGLLEDSRIRRALVLGCGLQLLQQLSGINTVMYYSATIFSMAGFSEGASIWLAAITAAAQSVGVCLGIYFIEKRGRRTLVLLSLGMVVVALVCLGTGFHLYDGHGTSGQNDDADEATSTGFYGWLVVGAMMTYLFTFGVGMSSVPWTVNAEIYPTHARSLGTSASTTVNWLGNVVVSATFLTLASDNVLGKDGAFWLYASIGVAGWIWLYGSMPETKGLSLEEIELLFASEGDPPRPGTGKNSSPRNPGVAITGATRRPGGFALLDDDGPGVNGGTVDELAQTGSTAEKHSWAVPANGGGSMT